MRRAFLAAMLATAFLGCRVGTGPGSIHSDLTDPAHTAIASCAKGDVDANLQIVSDLRDSYHEMIVCGGLALNFNSALVNVLANAALGRGSGMSQFSYQGNGTYATSNGMMLIRASLTDAQQAVGFDVLDPASYLVGIQIDATGAINVAAGGGGLLRAVAALDLYFQAEGPGFALLGLSRDETRGGHIHVEPKRISDALAASISLANRVNVDNQQGGTTVHYLLDGKPHPVREVLAGKNVPMELTSIEASHGSTGQKIHVTEWTVNYTGRAHGGLNGVIGVDVDGGAFPYHAVFDYRQGDEPSIILSCRQ